MRKASNIVLLVGAIVSYLLTALFIILSAIFFILGSPNNEQFIIDGLNNGTIQTSFNGTVEEKAAFIQLLSTSFGIAFVIVAILALLSGFMSLSARKKPTPTRLVLAIIFGAISGVTVPIIGAVFGFIANSKNE